MIEFQEYVEEDHLNLRPQDALVTLPLLSRDDERDLSSIVWSYKQVRNLWGSHLGNMMMADQFTGQMALAALAEKTARQTFIERNLGLVRSRALYVIKSAHLSPEVYEELFNEGAERLDYIAQKFDGNKGYKFSSYAWPSLERHLFNYVDEHSSTIKRPVELAEVLRQAKAAEYQLIQELDGTMPTQIQIAKRIGKPVSVLKRALKNDLTVISIDSSLPASDDEPAQTISETLPATETKGRFDHVDRSLALAAILKDVLTDAELAIVRIRYGFGAFGTEAKSYRQSGGELGLSHEWIRKIEAEIMKKLRKPSVAVLLAELL